MRYKILLILLITFTFILDNQAQNLIADTIIKSSIDSNLEAFTKDEIRKMDSMLNVWYIQNELINNKSVLSKLKDDSTSFDNNDSLIYHRLKNIITEVPLSYNNRVKSFINLYSVQRKLSSSVILGLAQYYYPWMKAIFDKYNVPEEIVYITIIESALNPTAVSPAGATGIWQFMYGTGKLYGLEVNTYVDDRRDPYKATDAAARHFRDLYNIFNDWGLAISAYNCGAGNVRKAIQRSGGKTTFWGVCPYLPKETQNYFPAYIGALYMMSYHDQYGITPTKISIPLSVDTVMVHQKIHFGQIASVLGLEQKEIQTLNPQYKRNIIPGSTNEPYPLRLKNEDLLRFIDLQDSIAKYDYDKYFNPTNDLNKATTTVNGNTIVQTTPNKYHYVRSGETLAKIASKYRVSVSYLKSINHLRSSSLRVGQRLLVKRGTTVTTPAPVQTQDSTLTDSTRTSLDSLQIKNKPDTAAVTKPAGPKEITYTIKAGDTLTNIAQRYHTTVAAIANHNKMTNIDNIRVGQQIKILVIQ